MKNLAYDLPLCFYYDEVPLILLDISAPKYQGRLSQARTQQEGRTPLQTESPRDQWISNARMNEESEWYKLVENYTENFIYSTLFLPKEVPLKFLLGNYSMALINRTGTLYSTPFVDKMIFNLRKYYKWFIDFMQNIVSKNTKVTWHGKKSYSRFWGGSINLPVKNCPGIKMHSFSVTWYRPYTTHTRRFQVNQKKEGKFILREEMRWILH